ncbi:hypothetical protein [Saccharothrix lopnurensis]|uniref:Uncharacterized protein n=1 Tax=Saccharothrix lopnurensis TaxID=1670621 RepID=A0ABW1P9Q5_9PSEU
MPDAVGAAGERQVVLKPGVAEPVHRSGPAQHTSVAALPVDFPPCPTVYKRFAPWEKVDASRRLLDALRDRARFQRPAALPAIRRRSLGFVSVRRCRLVSWWFTWSSPG